MLAQFQAAIVFTAYKTVKERQVEKLFKQVGDEVTEFTADEYAQHAADKVESVAKAKADEAEADAHATQKAALLARLGITADEAKLLIG